MRILVYQECLTPYCEAFSGATPEDLLESRWSLTSKDLAVAVMAPVVANHDHAIHATVISDQQRYRRVPVHQYAGLTPAPLYPIGTVRSGNRIDSSVPLPEALGHLDTLLQAIQASARPDTDTSEVSAGFFANLILYGMWIDDGEDEGTKTAIESFLQGLSRFEVPR